MKHGLTLFYCRSPILTEGWILPATINSHRPVAVISLREQHEMKKKKHLSGGGGGGGYSHARYLLASCLAALPVFWFPHTGPFLLFTRISLIFFTRLLS